MSAIPNTVVAAPMTPEQQGVFYELVKIKPLSSFCSKETTHALTRNPSPQLPKTAAE